MNDSFLEDLQLVAPDPKQVTTYPVDRHVTTRQASSSPLQHIAEDKLENLIKQKVDHTTLLEKQINSKELINKVQTKLSSQDTRKPQNIAKVSKKREKPLENKLKPIENKVKNVTKEQDAKDDIKKKNSSVRIKISESKVIEKDKNRCSGSCKENNYSSDAFSKENLRPTESSKESTSQIEISEDLEKKCNDLKKSSLKEIDTIALVETIKDLISTQTKQESTVILKTMQQLHLNSQANLIRNLLIQTDELIQVLQYEKTNTETKMLLEQNHKLQEDIIILQKKNDHLNKKMEDFDLLKQENVALKLKCKELSNQLQ